MTRYQRLSVVFQRNPTTSIVLLAAIIRISHIAFLYILSSLIPPFDTSHTLLTADQPSTGGLPGLRWDAIHFVSIAKDGHTHEQQLAFQPLFMGILRLAGEVVSCFKRIEGADEGAGVRVGDVVWGGMVVSSICWVGSCVLLYKLSTHLFNVRFALLATLLYMIPPSPVPSLPYTEPLYALTTFGGIYLAVAKRRYTLSGFLFACSTATRATGIFNVIILCGVILLDGIPISALDSRIILKRCLTRSWTAIVPCLLTVSPFLVFQVYAYQSFCHDPSMARPWCESKVPFAYGFVQKEYWNIGFLNYWTISNIPNILLPFPILITSLLGTIKHFKSLSLRTKRIHRNHTQHGIIKANNELTVTILYIHHIIMMCLILFNSHVQILLRTCITDPVIWWNVASVSVDWVPETATEAEPKSGSGKKIKNDDANSPCEIPQLQPGKREDKWQLNGIGRFWIYWSVIWGTVSTILWVGHYPPA
ncbi:uncharacterized protein I303_101117 [Kwoniella dejecticola CBS 10117]|uniref:GPI mannosyltransferase 2 n=1 Tax=Kwoniella dejecticola CBS 10117 TaxID=1296121 RepID=A0A1A6AGV5_9TREE|nr:uncharacterized protein I303_01121 [Kwoniella dejecticola CBS 10117]OBR89296.1 hypothetical protein I303_01121 [Kwoniella dejecticola CBS 10117]